MRVFARYNLVLGAGSLDDELLLEGSWPLAERRPGHWSLDDAIDARHGWLDRLAMELAERAGASSPGLNFAHVNALALRYYVVKLLRVIAFFQHVQPSILHVEECEAPWVAGAEPRVTGSLANSRCRGDAPVAGPPGHRRGNVFCPKSSHGAALPQPPLALKHHTTNHVNGSCLELHVAQGDEDYVELFQQLAATYALELTLHWRGAPFDPPTARRPAGWRQWAARATHPRRSPVLDGRNARPRVMLCGNPHVLNPVCAELVSRGAHVGWLYERFAVRSWLRWRAAGVEQLVCETGRRGQSSFSDVSCDEPLLADGVDLARPINLWLARRAADIGPRQSSLVERVESHFRRLRPTAIIVDEDATPLKRVAVAIGRSHGAASMVVQHGAPCGPFGFLPLAADKIAVWGDAAGRQLQHWGLPAQRVHTAGWPHVKLDSPKRPASDPTVKRFLLLATMPPRDERPDSVEFHLTSANYREMLDMLHRVLSTIDGATLTIKPHPRDTGAAAFYDHLWHIAADHDRQVPIKIVRTRNMAKLIAASDCVLSCASTAGIEAALAGAPVIQLLPAGSGDILPAEDWGFIGSARTVEELAKLIAQALSRGWQTDSRTAAKVLTAHGRAAAARIVDGVLEGAIPRVSPVFANLRKRPPDPMEAAK